MSQLTLTLIQSELFWEDKSRNLDHFRTIVGGIKTETDIILLPEMFTTGFSMKSEELAEGMNGPTVQWMKELASDANASLVGSFIVKANHVFYNRLVWVLPNGELHYYDKRHLFTYGNENEHYQPGSSRLIVEYKGWKICPMICYDLRFPVWSRNTEEFDLLLYLANWPEPRRDAWRTLLKARAIENLSFSIGVNRIGTDAKGLKYTGDSSVFDFSGKELFHCKNEAVVSTVTLNKEEMMNFRKRFNFLADRDDFELT